MHLARMLSLALSLCASSAKRNHVGAPASPRVPALLSQGLCGWGGPHVGLTFDSVQEILHGMLVEPEGLLVVLGFILFCGFCHQINGFLERQNI